MADIFSKVDRSRVMSTVRNRGSKIEKKVGDLLKASGIRYRTHSGTLPGKPDFYITKQKAVLFVDSCFWHGCRHHGSQPRTNTSFWRKKLARNKERDREINRIYREMGWDVIRIWEHNLRPIVDKRVLAALRQLKG